MSGVALNRCNTQFGYRKMPGDNIGLMYIAEQVSPEDNIITNLTYHDKAGTNYAEFETILQTFRCLNRNERKYWGPNIDEMLKAERIVTMLRTNAWYGEMDHPYCQYKDKDLSSERIQAIEMSRRSHKILRPKVKGDILRATIQTASGTEAGRGFYNEIIQGLIPSFSCRAIAGIQNINGEPYVIVRKLITYDWVLYPSHHDANMEGKPKFIKKSEALITMESAGFHSRNFANDIRDNYTQDILIPLKEILEYAGNKDVNTQVIMEAFDLSMDDIVGFDNGLNHVIIKDKDNTIYANMSPKTRHEVVDFLSSF